jgi:nucleoid-associated protein YgaU
VNAKWVAIIVAVFLAAGVGALVFTEEPNAPPAVVGINGGHSAADKPAPEAADAGPASQTPDTAGDSAAAPDLQPRGTSDEAVTAADYSGTAASEPLTAPTPDEAGAVEAAQPSTASSSEEPARVAVAQPSTGREGVAGEMTGTSSEPSSPPSDEGGAATGAATATEGAASSSGSRQEHVTITVKKRTPTEGEEAPGAADARSASADGTSGADQTAALEAGEAPEAAAPASAGDRSQAPSSVSRPTFDIVRVEPSGETVVAGRADPGAEVALVDGQREIGQAKANARGEFVILLDEPLSADTHELGLAAKTPEGARHESEDVVVVVVPERGETAPRRAGTGEGVVALLTPRTGEGGSQVLQRPGEAVSVPLSIDVIDYDAQGVVTVGGRAAPQTILQVYLNDTLAGHGQAREDGVFSLQLKDPVSVGEHSIRVDQTGADGKVLARAEAPFSRTAIAAELPPGKFVVVQPGNSLWRIARRTYGEGVRYTVIYGANNRQIRDPDLIYPGQIFIVPQGNDGTG